MTNPLAGMFNLFDFEEVAKGNMSQAAWEYLASGAADEITLRWNRESFDRIMLCPRVLVDTGNIDTSVRLLDQNLDFPVLLAPTAFQRLFHPEGEIAVARGSGAARATYIVSSYSMTPLEDIAREATQPLWFQLYIQSDRAFTRDVVQLAEALGCRSLCVTVDLPVIGVRNRTDRGGFAAPEHIDVPYMKEGFVGAPVTWDDIDWIRAQTKLPVILKGILNPSDAEIAARNEISGIIVSNHGARDLDTTPATIDALPRIADVVAGRLPILMDGGIRRGTDVLKALALGAAAVLIGRPYCYGLAAGGAEGVALVINILRMELEIAMALTGCKSIDSIDRTVLWEAA